MSRHRRLSPLLQEKKKSVAALKRTGVEKKFPPNYPFDKKQLAEFRASILGKIVYPWSPGYNDDRQEFDDLYPAYPAMIVYVICFDDIRECMDLAKKFNVQVAIRSSGHSLACYSVCNGIVIDVSTMNSVFVSPESSSAFIGPGANFGDIFPVIEQYNLHIPTGDCPTVCVSGFMMGGGYGTTSRAYGMNCDCVTQVSVMLADKKIVTANANQNKDLFWAICGGTGGNFGVLLQIGYKVFPLDVIYGVQVCWPIQADPQMAAKVLYTIQEQYLKDGAYPQLGIETILSTNKTGVKTVFFCATWIGDEQSFKTALQPLLSISGYTMKSYQGKYSYVNDKVLEGTPPGLPEDIMAYSRSAYISRSLSQTDWYNIAQYFYNTAPNQYTMIDMEAYGGKINQIPEGTNAFIHRNKKVDFFIDAFFDKKTNDREKNKAWTDALFKFMDQYTDGHSYQNYPYRDQLDFREAYWGKYYNQLVLIKQKYDPANFFNYQQSVGPDIIDDPKQVILFEPSPIVYESY